MGMMKHSQSTQSNRFAISLQQLKKEVKDEAGIIAFDGSGQTCPKYLKYEAGNIYNILRKSVPTAFVFYCEAKHSDILRESSHVRQLLHYTKNEVFH